LLLTVSGASYLLAVDKMWIDFKHSMLIDEAKTSYV